MFEHLQSGLEAEARARLSAAATNPADNDFDGKCIQCIEQDAVELELFPRHGRVQCDAFCSHECAEMFAFEMANDQARANGTLSDHCEHYVRDGEFCAACYADYIAAVDAARKGGVK